MYVGSNSSSHQTVNDEVKTIHQSIRTITPIIDLVGGRLAAIVKRLTCCFCGSRLRSLYGRCSLYYIYTLLFCLTILLTRLRYGKLENIYQFIFAEHQADLVTKYCWHVLSLHDSQTKLHMKSNAGELFCRFTKQSTCENYLSFGNVDMTIKMIHIWLVLCSGSSDQKLIWTNIGIRMVGWDLFDSTKSELLLFRSVCKRKFIHIAKWWNFPCKFLRSLWCLHKLDDVDKKVHSRQCR